MQWWDQQSLGFMLSVLGLMAGAIAYCAFHYRYFQLPPMREEFVPFKKVAVAFGLYFCVTLLMQPLVYYFPLAVNWIHLLYIFLTTLSLALYVFFSPRIKNLFFPTIPVRQQLRSFGLGVLSWIIYVPWVGVVKFTVDGMLYKMWGQEEVEQAAVRHLKETLSDPVLYGATLIAVIVIVPLCEELLFRGFLQNGLRRWVGRQGAMLGTALIFACAHYTRSQGLTNLSLIISLFVLAYGLSFLYEKERTLVAPLGLHITFNALSALMLVQ